MDNHMGGGWWWVMGVGWLVFLALIVLVVIFVVRQSVDPGRRGTSRAAEDVLSERLARGEIDEDEYRRRRDALRS
jgi:putative membrane protein